MMLYLLMEMKMIIQLKLLIKKYNKDIKIFESIITYNIDQFNTNEKY